MLEPGRGAKHVIATGVERGDAIAKVGNAFAIAMRDGFAGAEEIVVHVGGNHEHLVQQADQQRTILARPGGVHGILQGKISHAVRDDGGLCLAGIVGILLRCLLLDHHPVVEVGENVGQIVGGLARLFPVGQIAPQLAL